VLTLASAIKYFALCPADVIYEKHALSDMLEASVQALLGMSQIECVRPFFALPLPLIFHSAHNVEKGEKKGEVESSVTAVHVLLSLSASRPQHTGNCIGLLMNACLEPTAPAPCASAVTASATKPASAVVTATAAAASSSSSSSSSSHAVSPAILTVKEAVACAGGAALALKGVLMDSKDRSKFFESDPPEGT
jgi:hypothetical protein